MPSKQSTNQAKEDIQKAAEDAVKLIASSAAEAAKVIASAASEALKVANVKSSDDHDLLVKLDVKMESLQIAVNKLSEQDDQYVLKEDFSKFYSTEFTFWKNLLVTGLLVTIAMGIISKFLFK